MLKMMTVALVAAIAVPKDGPCPPNHSASGRYCVPGKGAEQAVPKNGPCPPRYSASGKYCVGPK